MNYFNICVIASILMGGTVVQSDQEPAALLKLSKSFAHNAALPGVIKALQIQPAHSIEKPGAAPKPTFNAASNVLTVASQNGAKKFADLAKNTSWLATTLESGPGKVTVFAFSDDAYDHSSPAVKAALADVGGRNQILQYHVAMGTYFSNKIAIHHKDSVVYSLYPSPPFQATSQYQPIHVDSYYVDGPGGEVISVATASGSPISTADLTASNGIVHIIDKVMSPVPTGADMNKYLETEPTYSSLFAALKAANLTLALSGPAFKPLTLFAPNNAAFSKLTPAQQNLLKNATILTEVLTYHVVVGSYYSAAIYEAFQLRSLEGSIIYFQKGAGGIFAEQRMVVKADTTVTNGVVHELDGVMFPSHL